MEGIIYKHKMIQSDKSISYKKPHEPEGRLTQFS